MGLASLASWLLGAAALVAATSGGPVVDLGYARYQGNTNARGVDEFLGLRFAAPPTGDLRWRKPRDPPQADGVQDATKFGAVCVGQSQPVAAGKTDEDCLFANVFAPTERNADKLLPVWVFVQGGSWQTDANANYNGSDLIAQSGHGVVHVNFNYRVAQLGFLCGESLGGDGGDCNVGLLDAYQLLRWVRAHIRQFGGDPDHVVLHGASAGAGTVSQLLTAHGGRDDGLFVGAIGDAVSWGVGARPADVEPHFQMFAEQVGCAGNNTDQLACLRGLDIAKIQAFNRSAAPTPGKAPWFNPVIDGDFVTGPQREAFRDGHFIKVPLIIGDAADEGTLFAPNASTLDMVRQTVQSTFARLDADQVDRAVAAYPGPVPVPAHAAYFSVMSAVAGESFFVCGGNAISAAASKIWNYRWSTTEPLAVQRGLGAWHTSDLVAVFGPGHTGSPPPAGDPTAGLGTTFGPGGINAAVKPLLQHYFISFFKTLDPNLLRLDGAPEWGGWGGGDGQRLRIQTNHTDMEAVPGDELQRCDVWKSLEDQTQQ